MGNRRSNYVQVAVIFFKRVVAQNSMLDSSISSYFFAQRLIQINHEDHLDSLGPQWINSVYHLFLPFLKFEKITFYKQMLFRYDRL